MNDGTLIISGERPAVRLEHRLDHAPTVVWQALTDREQLRTWFPCDVIVDGGQWKVGAAISFPFLPEVIAMTLIGEVLIVDEPNLLSVRWGDKTLRFELSSQGEGSRLVLIDELAPGLAARQAAGWETCLDRLVGLDPGLDAWQPRFEAYVAAFEAMLGPQEGPPTGYKGD